MLDRRGYFRWLLRGCDNVIQRLGWLWQALETLGSVFPTEPTEPQRINLLTVCTQQPWCHGNFKNGGEGQGVSVCVNVRERKNVHLCVCVFDFRSLGSGCSEAESLELSADLVPKVTIRSVYHRGAVCVCVCVRACDRFSMFQKCVHMWTFKLPYLHSCKQHIHSLACRSSARNQCSRTGGGSYQHLLTVTY